MNAVGGEEAMHCRVEATRAQTLRSWVVGELRGGKRVGLFVGDAPSRARKVREDIKEGCLILGLGLQVIPAPDAVDYENAFAPAQHTLVADATVVRFLGSQDADVVVAT